MDKTAESSRLALEGEICRWSGFARALRKEDRGAFDGLMDMCRSWAINLKNFISDTCRNSTKKFYKRYLQK
jgi:hypothetical protein